MTPTALLTDLRQQGVFVSAAEGKLKIRGPKDALGQDVQALLAAHREPLLELLGADPKVLVEKAGRQWLYLIPSASKWSEAEWRHRAEALSESIDRAHAAITAAGLSLKACGWICTPAGDWHRVGEAPDPATPDPVRSLVSETWEQVGTLLCGIDQSGPNWRPLEAAIDEAAAAKDLPALQAACEAYLEFAARVFDERGAGDGGDQGDDRVGAAVRDLPDDGLDLPAGVVDTRTPGAGSRGEPGGADGDPGHLPDRAASSEVATVQGRTEAVEGAVGPSPEPVAQQVLELAKRLRFPKVRWSYPGEAMGVVERGEKAWREFCSAAGPHYAAPWALKRLQEMVAR